MQQQPPFFSPSAGYYLPVQSKEPELILINASNHSKNSSLNSSSLSQEHISNKIQMLNSQSNIHHFIKKQNYDYSAGANVTPTKNAPNNFSVQDLLSKRSASNTPGNRARADGPTPEVSPARSPQQQQPTGATPKTLVYQKQMPQQPHPYLQTSELQFEAKHTITNTNTQNGLSHQPSFSLLHELQYLPENSHSAQLQLPPQQQPSISQVRYPLPY